MALAVNYSFFMATRSNILLTAKLKVYRSQHEQSLVIKPERAVPHNFHFSRPAF
jgi:hypothetical protein